MQSKLNLKMDAGKTSVSVLSNNSDKRKECPDEGWAWAVAIASCVINLIMSGLNRISGILFVAFIEFFEVDRQRASMPFSVRSSAGNLFGPIVGILGQKYGARKIITAGSIIGALSSAACFYTPDITWITILWGGISGIGATLSVTLPQVVIGQYFDKYKTTASGIAFSGGCVGSFLFPVILEYFLHHYGIEGTFLLIGAIILNTVPAALILKKPSWLSNQAQSLNDTTTLTETTHLSFKDDDEVFESTAIDMKSNKCAEVFRFDTPKRENLPTSATDYASMTVSVRSVSELSPKASTPTAFNASEIYPDIEFMQNNYELVAKIINYEPADENIFNFKSANISNRHQIMAEIENMCDSLRKYRKVNPLKSLSSVKRNLFDSEKDYLKVPCNTPTQSVSTDEKLKVRNMSFNEHYRAFILNKLSDIGQLKDRLVSVSDDKTNASLVITELQKLNKLYPRMTVTENIEPLSVSLISDSEFGDACGHSNTFSEHIRTAFLMYLNPLFLMVCLCRAVHFIAFIPAMTTVVDFCMDKGLREDEGKFAIIAISIGDLFGRLCFGWVTDRGYMTLPKYMMTVMIMQGMSTASLPLMNSEITIFSTLVLFGLLQGSLFVRHPVLISDYMKPHEQAISMGSVNFLSGLIGFGLPLYIGFFRDTLGSYSYIFYINGALGAVVGLLWAFEPFFVRIMNSKRTTQTIIA